MAKKKVDIFPEAKIEVELTLTEDLLATSPANESIFREYVEKKQVERNAGKAVLPPEDADEAKTLPPADEDNPVSGYTVFHRDDGGVFIYDYLVKGFLKESASVNADVLELGWRMTAKKNMDNYVFVFPRRLRLTGSDGAPIKEQDGLLERPIRVETMRGPRSALMASHSVKAGRKIAFRIEVLEQAVIKDPKKTILKILDYGKYKGLGQWRNGSYGRFTYTHKILE